MKAFLSHASADKDFVEQVFNRLGAAQAHYDAVTFEKAVLNFEAIETALATTDLFVLFVSERSLGSPFVSLESRLALERMAAGVVKKILVICLDESPLQAIPAYLRDLNIVTVLTSPGAAFRRIQGLLLELETVNEGSTGHWVGREEDVGALKKAMAQPTDASPTAIALAGQPGIGRRSLVRKAFQEVLPSFQRYASITVPADAGIDDIYLSLIRLRGRRKTQDVINSVKNFIGLDEVQKIAALSTEVDALVEEGETVMLLDTGGLLEADGSYQSYIASLFEQFDGAIRPIFVCIQQYMPPSAVRRKYPRVHYQTVSALTKEDVETLVGSRLKDLGCRYTQKDLDGIVGLVKGHPLNVEFAIQEIEESGNDVQAFLHDPSGLVIWRDRRAIEYIAQITFDDVSRLIIGILQLYRHVPSELLVELISGHSSEIGRSLNLLRGWHCIEIEDGVYSLNPILSDAFDRSRELHLDRAQENASAKRIVEVVEEYQGDDEIGLSLIEPGIIASIKAGERGANSQLRQLLLPSHLLRLARASYNNAKYANCIRYVEQALEMRHRMTTDARIEAFRLTASSAIRLGRDPIVQRALSELDAIPGNFAKRTSLFLKGFRARLQGRNDDAERLYLRCLEIDSNSFSSMRELAQIYLWADRYDEAEHYANAAYKVAPTNAFVIDIMVGTLIGRLAPEELDGDPDLEFYLRELEKFGRDNGVSFYARRMAEYNLKRRRYAKALAFADEAVASTPHLVIPYYIRAQILLESGKNDLAYEDIHQMEELIKDPQKDEGRFHLVPLYRLQMKAFLSRRDYRAAFNVLRQKEKYLPAKVLSGMMRSLAAAVLVDGKVRDQELLEWAKGVQ